MKTKAKSQSIRTLKSWLDATGVQSVLEDRDGSDLLVDGPLGPIDVFVGHPTEEKVVDRRLVISPKALKYSKLDKCLSAFHTITETLGLGNPMPVDRGPLPKKRSYNGEISLVVMRHKEFRAAPNPSREDFERYAPGCHDMTRWFLGRWRKVLVRHGYDYDDLYNLSLIWTTSFLHLYERLDEDGNNNEGLFRSYLKQRFMSLLENLENRAKNTLPAIDDYHLTMMRDPLPDRALEDLEVTYSDNPWEEDEDPDEDWIKARTEVDYSSAKTRKNTAAKLLAKKLSELPHDEMVAALEAASKNDTFGPQARQCASTKLGNHRRKCNICQSKDTKSVAAETGAA